MLLDDLSRDEATAGRRRDAGPRWHIQPRQALGAVLLVCLLMTIGGYLLKAKCIGDYTPSGTASSAATTSSSCTPRGAGP